MAQTQAKVADNKAAVGDNKPGLFDDLAFLQAEPSAEEIGEPVNVPNLFKHSVLIIC